MSNKDSNNFSRTILFGALLTLLAPGHSSAAEWSFSPSLGVSQNYTSNLFFSSTNVEKDHYTSVKQVFTLTGETERTKLNIDSTITADKFYKHDELDDIFYSGQVSVSHILTPRLTLDAKASFIHDATLQEQLEQAGLFARWTDRYSYGLDAGETCAITERFSIQLVEGVSQAFFPSGVYPDSSAFKVGLDGIWLLTPKDTLTISSLFTYSDYENISRIKELREMVEWKRSFDETLSLRLGAGMRLTEIKVRELPLQSLIIRTDSGFIFDPALLKARFSRVKDDVGPFVAASLDKNWSERLTSSISAGIDQYNDVNALVYERYYVGLSARYALSQLTSAGMDVKYYHNEEIGGGIEISDYVKVAPFIGRKLTEKLSIRASGSYEKQFRSFNATGAGAGFSRSPERFTIMVELKYTWPKFFSNK